MQKQAPPATLGQRLKAYREAAGLSVYAVAKRSGVDQSYIAAVERDKGDVSWRIVCAIADAVGVKSLDDLRMG